MTNNDFNNLTVSHCLAIATRRLATNFTRTSYNQSRKKKKDFLFKISNDIDC